MGARTRDAPTADLPSTTFWKPTLSRAFVEQVLPNKRLKLTGGGRFKGSGVFVPWRARTVVHHPCAGGRVARSLSAVRTLAHKCVDGRTGSTALAL